MIIDTATVITTEECEECSAYTDFSLDRLLAQDLRVTIELGDYEGQGLKISYEGEWVCRCGYDNSSIGYGEAQ